MTGAPGPLVVDQGMRENGMPASEKLWELGFPALIGAVVALFLAPVVEAMKLWLSRRSWAAQERWKLRVSIYERLSVALDTLESLLEPDYSSIPPAYSGLTKTGQEMWRTARKDLQTATALASLWLPPDLTKTLQAVQAADSYSDPSTWQETMYATVTGARKKLLAAAQKDLSL